TSGISLTSPTNQTSATVQAGQTATFNLQLTPTAFIGNVAINCNGAPAGTSCAISPASVAVSGNTPVPVIVTIKTPSGAAASLWPARFHIERAFWIPLLTMILFFGWLAIARNSGTRLKPSFALLILFLIGCAGCSGGISSNAKDGATTTLMVTATS